MTTGGNMRQVLLHGTSGDAFDRSVPFARRLAESFGAQLHVLYTIEEPLSAGWTAEMSADRLPDVHQAMEAEARERLARYIPLDQQDALGVEIALRTGPAGEELVRYTRDHQVDLAIVSAADAEHARALIDGGHCSVLVLR